MLQSPGQSVIETIFSSYCSKQSRYGNLMLIIRIILDKAKLTSSVEKRSETKEERYGSNTSQYVPHNTFLHTLSAFDKNMQVMSPLFLRFRDGAQKPSAITEATVKRKSKLTRIKMKLVGG
jgi:hypothetical protein